MNAEAFLKDTSARFIKVLQGKKIVAFAKWIVPIKFGKGGDDPDVMPSWPEDANAELCEEFFGELAKMRRQLMGYRPHYYLEMLGTLPECQGRGAAGQLIRWGLEQADRDGVEAYIEASPVGAPIYERFGWKAEAQVRALNGKYTELLMVRPAIGQGL
ncbi:hypothetical protein MMC06_002117 [Schaereria dolodes]|nr:hypothetical protein [Schaereria dolodes]